MGQGLIPPPRLRCCIALCHICDGPDTVQPYAEQGRNPMGQQNQMNQQITNSYRGAPSRIYIRVACPSCTLELVVFAPSLSTPGMAQSVACPMCGRIFAAVAAA